MQHTNTTHTHDWWANAAVASCRPNLNTRCHVCVLCMHKAQISVQRSDNLNIMLKHFPQTHQSSSMLVPCISFPFHIVTYPPIQYHSTSRQKFITKHIQQCLEACWTQTLSLKFGKNYKTVLTDNLNRYCSKFHTLYKLDTKRGGKPHFYWPLFFASTAYTT